MEIIDSFRAEYNWLSNFYKAPITVEGITYPTVEHGFQAAKTYDAEEKLKIANTPSPVIAKRIGKKVKLRDDWDDVKVEVMEDLLRLKFESPDLATKLISTGEATIKEGNRWHDNFWGACICPSCASKTSQNHLGLLLMDLREELRARG